MHMFFYLLETNRVYQTTIYYIWRKRGRQADINKTWTTTDQMQRRIANAVRNRVTSLKYKSDHK